MTKIKLLFAVFVILICSYPILCSAGALVNKTVLPSAQLENPHETEEAVNISRSRRPNMLLLFLLLTPFLMQGNLPMLTQTSSFDCLTRKWKQGKCMTFAQCFPMESLTGGDGSHNNALLQEMMDNTKSSSCVSRLNSVGAIEQTVCCPLSPQKTYVVTSTTTKPFNANPTGIFPQFVNLTTPHFQETFPQFVNVTTEKIETSSTISSEKAKDIEPTTTERGSNSNKTKPLNISKPETSGGILETGVTPTTITENTFSNNMQCGRVGQFDERKKAKITGGKEAVKGEFPWMVAIFGKNRKHTCGGALLNDHFVLTASHCLFTYNPEDVAHLSVTIGDHNIQSTQDGPHESRRISQIILHKGFEPSTYHNDVALLRLERPVKFTEYIRPICLPEFNSSWTIEGAEVIVAGWGRDRSYGYPSSTLRKVNIPVWKQSECQRLYSFFAPGRLTDTNICAGDGRRNKDACIGDSGGPLMHNVGGIWYQVGIVSWGKGCGSFPGVYTRLDQFLPWIQRNAKL